MPMRTLCLCTGLLLLATLYPVVADERLRERTGVVFTDQINDDYNIWRRDETGRYRAEVIILIGDDDDEEDGQEEEDQGEEE